MTDPELKRYADKKLKEGFSEDQVRASLIGAGYSEEQVKAAIYQAKETNKPAEQKKEKTSISFWWVVLLILLTMGGIALALYFRAWDPDWNPFNYILPM